MLVVPPPQDSFIEDNRSLIVEGREISPYDLQTVLIPLKCVLSDSVTTGTANYTIPPQKRLILRGLRPHLALTSPADADDAVTGVDMPGIPAVGDVYAGGSFLDRIYAKAMNCRIDLGFASRTANLFPRLTFPLSALFGVEGPKFSLRKSLGLPQGTTVDLTASLTDTDAAGSETEYGVVLVGALIPVAK